jgi:IS30 family transposase
VVKQHLQRGWSPEQIAGRLGFVSHETIYTTIYAMPRGQLRRELTSLLRQCHRARRTRRQGKDRRGQTLSIHVRPPEANERLLPGHWEGDFIVGSRNQSAVGTLVDRLSLFVMLARMQGGTDVAALEGFSQAFLALPQQRKTLTYDQGKEMALHAELSERTGLTVYFAAPHSPWQRGLSENTNGLLRQYLPKGEDLSVYSQRDLDQIAWLLNTRPRKSLGYRTPAEVFFEKCFDGPVTTH